MRRLRCQWGDSANDDALDTTPTDLRSLEEALGAQPKKKTKVAPKGVAAAAPKCAGETHAMKASKASLAMKVADKAAAKAAPKKLLAKRPAAAASTDPKWGFENGRQQVMCRTGLPGEGQCHAIKFAVVGGRKAAAALGDKWLAAEKKKRGIK